MSEENLRIVRAGLDAWARGDEPAMLDLVDPSVVGTPVPDLPDHQDFHGHEGLLRARADWIGTWDDYSIAVRDIRDFDDRVLASCVQRGRGKGSGTPMEVDTYFLFTLRAGKLVRWQAFLSEQQALDTARSAN